MKNFLPILVALLVSVAAAPGQNLLQLLGGQGHASPGEERSEDEARTQLEWAKGQADEARKALEGFDGKAFEERLAAAGLSGDRAGEMEDALTLTARNYEGAVSALETVLSNRKSLDAAAAEPPPPVPGDPQGLDELRDRVQELRTRLAAQTAQMDLDAAMLDRHRHASEEAGRVLRRAQEALDAAGPADKPRAALQASLAEHDYEAKSSQVFLSAWRFYGDELEREQTALRLRAAENSLVESGLDTLFDRQRAQAALEALAAERAAVLPDADKAKTRAEELARAAGEPAESGDVQQAMDGAASTAERIARGYEGWLAGLDARGQIWQAVLAVLNDPESTQPLDEARALADSIVSNLKPWFDLQAQHTRDSSRRLAEIEAAPTPQTAAGRRAAEALATEARKRDRQLRDLSVQSEILHELAARLATESRTRLAELSPAAKATGLLSELNSTLQAVWQTELFTANQHAITADGTPVVRERSITLGKILVAAAVTILALLLARLAAGWISHNLRTRLAADTAKVLMIERGAFIALAALIVLTALNWLQIPLTAFAFLGGALAIGFGFGVQTLMNNFISGLILTAEQRIKVGDIIEVDDERGRVLSLGTRCATVRKFDGVEILVPNSHLLENTVSNWTLADPHHRFDFVVGVAYGSDTRAVLEILKGCLADQPELLTNPPPEVFFEEFGDSALNFRLYYWVDMRICDVRQVGSELRLRIDARCRGAEIEIAFPQRDVHLHAARPIRVALES